MARVDLFSCEKVARSTFGTVQNKERLGRIVLSKNHINKKTGEVKPSVFPPSHIGKTGLSLMRIDMMDEHELTHQADAVADKASIENVVAGVLVSFASELRKLQNDSAERLLCVVDDPTDENEAHSFAIKTVVVQDEADIKEIRDALLTMFLPLVPVSGVY